MTDAERTLLDEARDRHQPVNMAALGEPPEMSCRWCYSLWPCQCARLLEGLDAALTQRETLAARITSALDALPGKHIAEEGRNGYGEAGLFCRSCSWRWPCANERVRRALAGEDVP